MKKTYEWKELNSDGNLVEPKEVGNYYDSTSLNYKAPFKSEFEAMAEFELISSKYYDYMVGREYVLVTVYEV